MNVTLFAEFDFPASAFALAETLASLPKAIIEIERVVASEDVLVPYFWTSNVPDKDFEHVAESDPSIRDLRRLDSYEDAILYRAEWTDNIESIVYAYMDVDAVILSATGKQDTWDMQMRFDDHDQLTNFRTHCRDNGITILVKRLHEVAHPHPAEEYGLTEKQREALVRAWHAGFFESPADTTLEEVAAQIGISQQALSERTRKGYDTLIAHTLIAEPQHHE